MLQKALAIPIPRPRLIFHSNYRKIPYCRKVATTSRSLKPFDDGHASRNNGINGHKESKAPVNLSGSKLMDVVESNARFATPDPALQTTKNVHGTIGSQ